jgi:preprotein translocase subunit YajC
MHFAILTETASTTSSLITMLLPFAVLIVVFYFLLIRPENKKKKALNEMRNALAVGDEVTTIGGIVGKVVHIKDDLITIETSEDRVRIQLARWAVSTKGTQTTENA